MKLPTNANHVKVPLSALRITGNVRKNFDPEDIERLAQSIRQDGLMNPITVRPPVEDENGNKTYEVIAGGRRVRAHQWLCDHGDDFAMIECCVRTGDTWTLQMIENIQRTDLSPREKEDAVAQAMESGMTMTDIAEKLCKPISYVSDLVAGMKVRKEADEAGIATDKISTKALSQLRSIPEEARADAIAELAENGGTFREATRVLHEYKKPSELTKEDADEHSAPMCKYGYGQLMHPICNKNPDDVLITNVSSEAEAADPIDPFDIEPEDTEQEFSDTDTAPAEKTEAGGTENGRPEHLFLTVTTWQPKNKLQEELVEFILPFSRTALCRNQLMIFISFLEITAEKFCAKYPKTKPVKITYPRYDLDSDSGHIACQCTDAISSDVFCVYYQDIKGDAMDLVRDYTAGGEAEK